METVQLDKRRFPRIDEAVCAWLSFKKDSAAYGTTTMDLGLEGARFTTLKRVDVGDNVIVCLQLPWMSIQCKGKVCWLSAETGGLYNFGVRFLDLRDNERDFLNRYVRHGVRVHVNAQLP